MRGPIVRHKEAIKEKAAERYVLGELRSSEREQFEEHFFSCPDCARDVRDLAALTEVVRELPPEPPLPPSPAWYRMWVRLGPSLAWGGALALVALFAVYQTAQLHVAMRPQTLASILLLPETKGEVAAIPVQRMGTFRLLECDLPGSAGDLEWELRRTGSEKILGRQAAPAPVKGVSFKVLLPSSALAPGDYTLTVRSISVPPGRSWLFRFKIDSSGT